MIKSKPFLLLIICIVSTLFVLGCSVNVQTNQSNEIIAKVNDIPITRTEFNLVKTNLELTSFLAEEIEEITHEDVLKSLTKRKVLGQEAKNRGIGLSDEEFQEVIDVITTEDSEVEIPPHIIEALDEFLKNNNLEYENFKEYSIAYTTYFYRDNSDSHRLQFLVLNETYDRLLAERRKSNSDIDDRDIFKIERQHRKVAEKEINKILQEAKIQILDPSLNISNISFNIEVDDRILTFKGESPSWKGVYTQDNATGSEDKFMFKYKGSDSDSIRLAKVTYKIDAESSSNLSRGHGGWKNLNAEGIIYLDIGPFGLEENSIINITVEWYTPAETFEETFKMPFVNKYQMQ